MFSSVNPPLIEAGVSSGPTVDSRLGLDPRLCLRNDVDRDILITRPPPLSDRSYLWRALHPSEAVVLSLLNGSRTIDEVGDIWAEVTNKSREDGRQDVERLVGLYTSPGFADDPVLVPGGGSDASVFVDYDPLDFVIPADRLNLTERRLRIPYRVYFIPTLYCSQKCIYCYAKLTSRPEVALIAIERLKEIFDELASLGVDVIQMSGGEIFTRKSIFVILAAIMERGMVPDIPTKIGPSFRTACRLRDLGIPIVQVSLDSADPVILDRMVGITNYHRRAFAGMANLRRAGMNVRVNTVLTPLNTPTIGSLIDYLGQLGNVTQVTLTPYGRSLFCHNDALFVDSAHLESARDQAHARLERYPHMRIGVGDGPAPPAKTKADRERRWRNRAYCTANRDGFVILPDGRVTVCEELYDHPEFIIGDLTRQSVMEMWNSPRALSLMIPDQEAVPAGPCRGCEHFLECNSTRGRCWRDVLKTYGWNKGYYPDPRCPRAPEGLRLG
jgi:radical SAM protein with 4Fe4S-binding SPASM domain